MNTITTNSKKITILLDNDVYQGLCECAGKGNIGKFISRVVRPYVFGKKTLADEYKEMAKNEKREKEALLWSENLIKDHEQR